MKLKTLLKLTIAVSIVTLFNGCTTKKRDLYYEISKKHNVNYKTMRAICEHESGNTDLVVNVNKSKWGWQEGAHYFDSKQAASLYMNFYLKPFGMNYDIGACQVNSQHIKAFKTSNVELLDKEKNINVAASIYKYNVKACKGEIRCALSMYNTGRKESTIGMKYAEKVLKIRTRMFD